MGPLAMFRYTVVSPRPHLVELNRAEDVNALREKLLDVAEQMGVHGGTEDMDTGTVRDLIEPGMWGQGHRDH